MVAFLDFLIFLANTTAIGRMVFCKYFRSCEYGRSEQSLHRVSRPSCGGALLILIIKWSLRMRLSFAAGVSGTTRVTKHPVSFPGITSNPNPRTPLPKTPHIPPLQYLVHFRPSHPQYFPPPLNPIPHLWLS